jgi:predicted HTH transcriptional regulator
LIHPTSSEYVSSSCSSARRARRWSFKRDLSGPDRVLRTIVAFANTAGGTVLVGVEDRTGHVRGVAEPLDLPIRIAIFDDRCEVENAGLLPFGLTVEDLPRGVSKLRNRVIGRGFHALGLVEQWGSGIQRMTSACREMGLAPPRFEEIATRFRVTLSTQRIGRRCSTRPTRRSSRPWPATAAC